MHKSVGPLACVLVFSAGAIAGCSSSSNLAQRQGIQVTVVNSNKNDVMIYGYVGRKSGSIPGCLNPACPGPKPGEDVSGSVVSWTETRKLPHRYRMVLLPRRRPLHCPPATGRPAGAPSSTPYAVVYDITPRGHCVVVGHTPLD